MAYGNRGDYYKFGCVRNRDVLIMYYGFPIHSFSADTTSGTPQIFKPQEIGTSRYRSASVSVVKAFNRLVKRGLAIRKYNHGIILTEGGTKVAKTLI